jgi:hypothetical protein
MLNPSGILSRLVACATVSLVASFALAQSANYTSVEVGADKLLQLSYHASVHKDCTAGRLPTVRVIEPPTSGTLTVREAELTTTRVRGCPTLKMPARVVFYQSRPGYAGPDHVKYEVTSENGEVTTYDTTITVKRVPAQGQQPNMGPDTRGLL